MQDETSAAAYVSKLGHRGRGAIAIHHTNGIVLSATTPFVAFGSYDVTEPHGKTYHFDASGNELILANPAAGPASPGD